VSTTQLPLSSIIEEFYNSSSNLTLYCFGNIPLENALEGLLSQQFPQRFPKACCSLNIENIKYSRGVNKIISLWKSNRCGDYHYEGSIMPLTTNTYFLQFL